jgi:hypothetical protein
MSFAECSSGLAAFAGRSAQFDEVYVGNLAKA